MKYSLLSAALLLPGVASAQFASDGGPFGDLLVSILGFANNVLIPFILGIGFLFFVWGMFLYFILGGAKEESKEKGKSLLINATIGFVVILIFWGVVNLIAESTGFAGSELQNIPTVFPDEQ